MIPSTAELCFGRIHTTVSDHCFAFGLLGFAFSVTTQARKAMGKVKIVNITSGLFANLFFVSPTPHFRVHLIRERILGFDIHVTRPAFARFDFH